MFAPTQAQSHEPYVIREVTDLFDRIIGPDKTFEHHLFPKLAVWFRRLKKGKHFRGFSRVISEDGHADLWRVLPERLKTCAGGG